MPRCLDVYSFCVTLIYLLVTVTGGLDDFVQNLMILATVLKRILKLFLFFNKKHKHNFQDNQPKKNKS